MTTFANARDVGGLRLSDGGQIQSGVLFRSDAPRADDELPPLAPWPPSLVVDLRSDGERAGAHPMAGAAEVIELPLLTNLDPTRLVTEGGELTLAILYDDMLTTSGSLIAEIARLVARTDGSCLVHCSAGKDRTGVTFAALLAAVGVDREQIVADYAATEPHMPAVFDRLVHDLPEPERTQLRTRLAAMPGDLGTAPRTAIEKVLTRLDASPGRASGWLVGNGLKPHELDQLRNRLTAPTPSLS